jgi:hypothetical protein
MPKRVTLYTELENEGESFDFEGNQPTLPPEISAKAKSLSVWPQSFPVRFYEGPGYTGLFWTGLNAGGIDDLAAISGVPGNWRDRIRSIYFT